MSTTSKFFPFVLSSKAVAAISWYELKERVQAKNKIYT